MIDLIENNSLRKKYFANIQYSEFIRDPMTAIGKVYQDLDLTMTPEARAVAGISDGLLRLSVGIEAAQDLAADISAALDRASQALARPVVAVAGAH